MIRRIFLTLLALLPLLQTRGETLPADWADRSFEVGKGTFLLDGEPFTVKAAELHYPRIPREYWGQRLDMVKALGMNAVCMYVFWNVHEQRPGEFDFTGQNDIAEFVRMAGERGLMVIVRPGPYVCAEWEMGGLPWWLLQEDGVELRSLDPRFMEPVKRFLNAVGEQLAPLQIGRGGPIIMAQVENEFGSYGEDRPYVSAVRDAVREAGFDAVPLFQCDWSSNFTLNGLDDLLWTINFGTGADIDKEFDELSRLRPDSPLMCSEYWSGWFDHWGRPHETRPADAMVQGITDMLDRDISFSLYMTHGGTTFGHWGGANNPPYSAMCSSYDYDAPIDEAGHRTPKYELLRAELARRLPAGETLPEPPADYPVTSVADFTLTEFVPLARALDAPHESVLPLPMEKYGQGWGSLLYETVIPVDASGASLVIDEARDYAQVWVGGRKAGELDRRHGQKQLPLGDVQRGDTLRILVDALGRVNFDRSIHDRKGIVGMALLCPAPVPEGAGQGPLAQEPDPVVLTGWRVYPLPTDPAFAASRPYAPLTETQVGEALGTPGFWRGVMTVESPADTWLDMSEWGKGLVYVNGHCLSRFWEIGPQQTAFLPGAWLREGANEVMVFDSKGPRSNVLRGLDHPVLDMLRPEYDRPGGSSLGADPRASQTPEQ